MTFNQWVIEKKVKNSDLAFTKALKSSEHLEKYQYLADHACSLGPSFSSGLQVLEWLTDLTLADFNFNESSFFEIVDFESLKSLVRKHRYPLTTHLELEKIEKFKMMTWPTGSKPKFERRGDRFGAEIKIFISNEIDLAKTIAGLERLKVDFENSESKNS